MVPTFVIVRNSQSPVDKFGGKILVHTGTGDPKLKKTGAAGTNLVYLLYTHVNLEILESSLDDPTLSS